MRIPRLTWNRRHNVAALSVSYARRVWHTRQVGDVILGFNATGRLARVVLLAPNDLLPPDATVTEALACVTELLIRTRAVRQADLDVLRSALERADQAEKHPA